MFAYWELFVVVMLVLLHGFFAAAEISILTAKRGRLEQQAIGVELDHAFPSNLLTSDTKSVASWKRRYTLAKRT